MSPYRTRGVIGPERWRNHQWKVPRWVGFLFTLIGGLLLLFNGPLNGWAPFLTGPWFWLIGFLLLAPEYLLFWKDPTLRYPPPRRISVARDFSRFPAGRYRRDGEASGEAFREDVLKPALRRVLGTNKAVLVDLNGTLGFGSSWLHEAFQIHPSMADHLIIESTDDPSLASEVQRYLKESDPV